MAFFVYKGRKQIADYSPELKQVFVTECGADCQSNRVLTESALPISSPDIPYTAPLSAPHVRHTAWIENCQKATGLDYTPIAPKLEALDAARNPNDSAANARFLNQIYETTARHEAGKQLPIAFKR